MPQGDPGGHFADTGGYGSFNQGGGGFQSGGSLSGGRGEYGLAGDRSSNSGNVGAYSDKSAGGGTSAAASLRAYQKKQAQLAAAKKAAAAAAPVVDPVTGVPVPGSTYPSYFNPGDVYPGYPDGPPSTFTPGAIPGAFGTGGFNMNLHDSFNESGFEGSPLSGGYGSYSGAAGRQFGGPVAPGGQYTVGENGPETLQMGPGGGGQVIPHNPMDRLGGMRPEMMQQFHQLLQQWHQGRPQGGPGQQDAMQDWRGQRPERPQMGGPPMPPQQPQTYPPAPQQPPQQGGGWQNRMGIEGLSRPMRPPGGGFGLSGLGQPGVLPQLRQQQGGGFGGSAQ